MTRRILSVVLIFSILIGGKAFARNVLAEEDLSYIDDVTKLEEIKDDPAALAKVKSVRALAFEYDPRIEEDIKLILLCPNLESVYICAHDTRVDKEFLNALTTTSDQLTLNLQWGTVDLEGVDNPFVTELYFCENTVVHYENVLHFENLQSLNLDNISGYCQIDYTKLPHLYQQGLVSQRIENYKEFCQKAANLRELSLYCCNLRNRDTKYLTAYLKDLESLDLYGTYVDDLSFLKDLPKLQQLNLPLCVSDLSVLYELPNLQSIGFEAYTELFVDEKLTSFLDERNVMYPNYDREIRNKVDQIVSSLNIPENASEEEKIEIVTKYVITYMTCEDFDKSNLDGTMLDICVNTKRGVCHDYATLHYTLLKSVGIDAYLMVGYSADAYNSPPGSHAWVEVCVDGNWYGIDAMWADDDVEDPFSPDNMKTRWAENFMSPTHADENATWPVGDFTGHWDELFPLEHITMNDPMDTFTREEEPEEDDVLEMTLSEETSQEAELSEAAAVESSENASLESNENAATEAAESSMEGEKNLTPAPVDESAENGSSKGLSHKTFVYIGVGITLFAVAIVGFIFAKKREQDNFYQ